MRAMGNEKPHAIHELERRTLLRGGLLTGLGAAVVGAATPALLRTRALPPRTSPVSAQLTSAGIQNNWAWCNKCRGQFFGQNQSSSWCPAGDRHDGSGSYPYFMYVDQPVQEDQANWAWCNKCQGLFYGPNQSASWCPAGDRHDGSGSYNYDVLNVPQSGSYIQNNWAWCDKCQGLFYKPQQSSSYCPAGGQHDGSHSDDYALSYN
jgi:hypothetical protein